MFIWDIFYYIALALFLGMTVVAIYDARQRDKAAVASLTASDRKNIYKRDLFFIVTFAILCVLPLAAFSIFLGVYVGVPHWVALSPIPATLFVGFLADAIHSIRNPSRQKPIYDPIFTKIVDPITDYLVRTYDRFVAWRAKRATAAEIKAVQDKIAQGAANKVHAQQHIATAYAFLKQIYDSDLTRSMTIERLQLATRSLEKARKLDPHVTLDTENSNGPVTYTADTLMGELLSHEARIDFAYGAYIKPHELRRALEVVEKAIRYRPYQISNYTTKADIFIMQNRRAKAIEAYREALKIDPSNTDIHVQLAKIDGDKSIGRYRPQIRWKFIYFPLAFVLVVMGPVLQDKTGKPLIALIPWGFAALFIWLGRIHHHTDKYMKEVERQVRRSA